MHGQTLLLLVQLAVLLLLLLVFRVGTEVGQTRGTPLPVAAVEPPGMAVHSSRLLLLVAAAAGCLGELRRPPAVVMRGKLVAAAAVNGRLHPSPS